MTIALVGISLYKFFDNGVIQIAGILVIGISNIFLLGGIYNTLKLRKKIEQTHLTHE